MVTNDATLLRVKHDVLYEVAKAAWDGQLDEKKEEIPYRLIPGPQAQFRCCIYKEREIIRQRVKLAVGQCPSGKDSSNVVQVINAACEECPIASYIVTDNCRKCMGKACQNSCHFGAITMGENRAHIDPNKCKECGMCANACPYNAIAHLERPCKKACPVDAITYDEYGICVIDEKKCIQCGMCIHSCPFGAIGSKTFIVDVINLIRAGKRVVAMIAPAVEGQFGPDITMASWRTALKKIGFADMIEVALGGDMTAASEAEEWAEAYKEGKKMTTSCCPAFVNMKTLSGTERCGIHYSFSDVRRIPYDKGGGPGDGNRVYRTLYCQEERDHGSEYSGKCGLRPDSGRGPRHAEGEGRGAGAGGKYPPERFCIRKTVRKRRRRDSGSSPVPERTGRECGY